MANHLSRSLGGAGSSWNLRLPTVLRRTGQQSADRAHAVQRPHRRGAADDEEEFNELTDQFEDYSSYHSGTNDDEMFDILFSMNDEIAYDLIEDYNKEWGKYIEIITE